MSVDCDPGVCELVIDDGEQSNPDRIVEPSVPSAPPSPIMSRRRMAFRPHLSSISSSSNPLNTLAAAAEAASQLNNDNSSSPKRVDGDSASALKRKKSASYWSTDDMFVFYEALKLHGRDWEACFKVLQKKKCNKNKEQMKNFYFNVVRLVRQQTNIENDDNFFSIPKDSRELLMMINALEWKKRTGNMKYLADNMKQLLFEGSTTIRLKRKKQTMIVVKTPACPSLLKLFSVERRLDRFPADVFIQLSPETYGDAAVLSACQRNPFLRIRMSTNDRVHRLFELLQVKWAANMKYLAMNVGDPIYFRLFPSRETSIGRVVLAEVHPANVPCFNRLLRDQEETVRVVPKTGKRPAANTAPSYTVSVSTQWSLSLTNDVLQNGMEIENVRDATIAELYCACGMSPVINLVYQSIGAKPMPAPWLILSQLLTKDYGDVVSSGVRDPDDVVVNTNRKRDRPEEDHSEKEKVGEPAVKSIRSSRVSPSKPLPPPSIPSVAVNKQPKNTPRRSNVFPSTVVAAENAAFMLQMEQFNQLQRGGGRRSRRLCSSTVPTSVLCPIPSTRQTETPKEKETTTTNTSDKHFPEFASILDENTSSTCSLLASLRTPSKNDKEKEENGKGGKKTDKGKEKANTSFQSIDNDDTRARCSHHDTTTRDLEIQCFGGPLDLSPMKSTSGFPEDLQPSVPEELQQMVYSQMINQNSIDFCSNFEQLVNHLDQTPQKDFKK